MRRALILVAAAAALAGCGGGKSASAPKLPAGAIVLPSLPAQGLLVEEATGVAFVGLDGKRLARLPRFHLFPRNGGTHDFLIQNLDQAGRPAQPRLVGPRHRWYRLDAGRHALLPLARPRVQLPGGVTLLAHGHVFKDGGIGFAGYTVVRGATLLVPRDRSLRLVLGRYVQTRGTLVDFTTETHLLVPQSCYAGGVHADAVYAACQRNPQGPKPPSVALERIARDGSAVPLATIPRMYVDESALSPDGRFLATHVSPGCGAGYVFVAKTAGGAARLVSGGTQSDRSPYSGLLGWSADGRVVVTIMTPACDGNIRSGVYLVDPQTLKRTFVTRSAWSMWNPYPEAAR